MAATFNWSQRNGAGGTSTLLGASGNLWNFKANDTAIAADYSANPVTAGQNSMEVWLRAYISGGFNQVRDFRFWMSTAFSPMTGLSVKCKPNQVIYLQPSAGTSSIATSSIPTSDPGSANVSIGGSLTSCLTSCGYSDHIVIQVQTTTAAPAGDSSLAVFTLSYSEN